MGRPIIIVQGGQYGSEGKGQVVAALTLERMVEYGVRTGAINAGHTVYRASRAYKMQQIPCSWVNPSASLVIGPGAYIHPRVLANEIKLVDSAFEKSVPTAPRLWIDYRAGLHLPADEEEAKIAGRHHLIGATGKGCAEAILHKIADRGGNTPGSFHDWYKDHEFPFELQFCDVPDMLTRAYQDGHQILIEGTQGSMLDLHLGPYPYVTSRMTSAANWVAEAGLSPALDYEIALVCRTFPIRVAGNSGPMPGETNWPDLVREMNRKVNTPLVREEALVAFEAAVVEAARGFNLPNYLDPLRQETWAPEDRKTFRVALSEINAKALDDLFRRDPYGAFREISAVFERTTVTNKLRRVARMDLPSLRMVVTREHPAYIVLSFLNYVFPQTWGDVEADSHRWPLTVHEYIDSVGTALGCPVKYVTTGPLTSSVIKVR